jgi:tetratricopeptide (TPR) repeat protein
MADENPEDTPSAATPGESAQPERRRRIRLTPERRRFLGAARSLHDSPSPEQKTPKANLRPVETPAPKPMASGEEPGPHQERIWKLSRVMEMQNLVLLFGAAVLLAGIFYAGKKYESLKYFITSRKQAEIAARVTRQFGTASAEDLVEQAIVAERLGNWEEAAQRLIAAKYKNLALPGVIFRAAKLYYDHNDFDSADRLFESSISFGENVDAANYFRGMIASGRSDFTGAERFFEAATSAAPFNADYYYSLAETCRKDHRPKEAIARYEQAARRAAGDEEQVICRFKARMASLEAGEVGPVSSELEKKRSSGPLSVDWLLTAAALEIHQLHVPEAIKLVEQAREADQPQLFALFAACVSDRLFTLACQNNPEVAQACRVESRNTSLAQPHESVKPEPP